MAASAFVGVVVALSRPDSPWCDDEGDVACPAEVRYDDRMYVAQCLGRVAVTLQDDLSVLYHAGGKEIERRAWTVDDVAPEDLIMLDEAGSDCDGTEMAYGEHLSVSDAESLLRTSELSDESEPAR